jgi:hypothetical protein
MIDRIDNNDGGDADGDGDPHAVQESQIRKMTRLAIEYQAVNLSQGVYMCVCVCVCMCVCVCVCFLPELGSGSVQFCRSVVQVHAAS